MLILNEKDMRRTVTYGQVMDKVEEAFRLVCGGEFFMPERPVIASGENTLIYMPCFLPDGFGTKCLTVFPENTAKGLPYIDGLMLLNDGGTGKTKAIMDAKYLTGLRTGAAGGVSIRNFSRADCKTAGVIGAGRQGFFQAIYASVARNIEDIFFFDIAPKDWGAYMEDLARDLARDLGGRATGCSATGDRAQGDRAPGGKAPALHICDTVEELLENSEIVITATPATSPVMPDDAGLLRGKCFVAIGSYKPHMRELPDAIWQLVDCAYTELVFALEESGDFSQPIAGGILQKERVKLIGEWLAQEDRPLPSPGQTTFFKTVGMGLVDLCVGRLIYEKAMELGVGQQVEI